MKAGLFAREAIANVRGHRLLSVATTMTIALILMIFGLFLLIFLNLRGLGGTLREQVRLTAFLQDGLVQEEIRVIEELIRRDPAVGSVEFTSKDQALAEFQGRMQGEVGFLRGLGENPLPASFEVKPKPSYQTPEAVKGLSQNLRLIRGVEEVQDGLDWLGHFAALSRFIQMTGLGIGLLIGIAVITITANTIKLSIYARREEIELMRLIGAKEGFIRAPFFIEGALVGMSGAAIALLALSGLFFLFQRRFEPGGGFLGGEIGMVFFPIEMIALLLLMATVLGGMGGYFSVKRSVRHRAVAGPT